MKLFNGGAVGNLMRVWSLVKGVSSDELRRLQQMDVRVALTGGSGADRARAMEKLGAEGSLPEYEDIGAARSAGERLVLDVGNSSIRTEAGWSAALASLAQEQPERRIALAAKYPGFRPVITQQLTGEYAARNAKSAAMSALPGIVPAFDILLPATAAGDMLLITKSQITLLLEIAACYNLPPDVGARLAELVPVVGGAFGWRALAREALGLVPGGVGVAVKAGVAYAGTYAVGRGASYYYASGGKKIDLRQVYRSALTDGLARGKAILERRKGRDLTTV